MANPEHLRILKKGVEVWNRWREENPEVRPDLTDTSLEGAELQSLNLIDADLRDCRLDKSNLERAKMLRARLERTRLSDASLYRADMRGGYLRNAYLARADLRYAILGGARFQNTVLWQANVASVSMSATILAGVDLSTVKGLAEVQRHQCEISTTTIEETAAGLSRNPALQEDVEIFLRRSGVPASIMATFPAMIERPPNFASCFISYSHSDRGFAHRLHEQLQARGIRCWLDEHDMKPGGRILDVVNDAIRLHDKILLCCSESSLESWWVKDEIRKAMERERRDGRDIIIPLMVDHYLLDGLEDGLAADLRCRLAANFIGWENDNAKFEEQFERLVRALRTDKGTREKAPELS